MRTATARQVQALPGDLYSGVPDRGGEDVGICKMVALAPEGTWKMFFNKFG